MNHWVRCCPTDVLSLTLNRMQPEANRAMDLLCAARHGDADAFGELCRVYETRLLRQAMTLCRNTTVAEELAQDTLVEAWKSLRSYNEQCQFFTWLCAILFHRYRNTLRKREPLAASALLGADREQFNSVSEQLPDESVLPDRAVESREQAALVLHCISMLPPKHQQVIYLRFYVDDSLAGIAAALDCSVGTVKSRLFSALEKLRAMKLLNSQSFESNIANV